MGDPVSSFHFDAQITLEGGWQWIQGLEGGLSNHGEGKGAIQGVMAGREAYGNRYL